MLMKFTENSFGIPASANSLFLLIEYKVKQCLCIHAYEDTCSPYHDTIY